MGVCWWEGWWWLAAVEPFLWNHIKPQTNRNPSGNPIAMDGVSLIMSFVRTGQGHDQEPDCIDQPCWIGHKTQ